MAAIEGEDNAQRIARLLAANEAPVKVQYLAGIKPKEPAAAVNGSGTKKESGPASGEVSGKSKRQQKRDLKKKRAIDLCTNFVLHQCRFGAKCRYSHDLDTYFAAMPEHLPGSCPFTCTGKCPFGISCRWAASHTDTDELHTKLKEFLAKQASEAAEAKAAEAADASEAPAAPASQPDLPAGIVPLTPATSIQPTLNALPKEVQQKLWKNRYDFTRADAVLKDLGVRVSFKPSRPAADAVAVPTAAAAASTDAAAPAAEAADMDAQPAAPAPVAEDSTPGAAEAVQEAEQAAAGDDMQPVPKRIRVEVPAETVKDTSETAAYVEVPLRTVEKKIIDFRGKTILAPLTTVGNLPYRRVCKLMGADVTVGEMALCTNLLQGQASEWALMKRHPSEDIFGVQIAGGYADAIARCCQLIEESTTDVQFIDINCGCPIDLVCDKGAGSALLKRPKRIMEIMQAAHRSTNLPITMKTRKGYNDDEDVTHTFVDQIRSWGPIALTLHGRTRQQRYSRQADWTYIERCAELARPTGLQLIGNGDVFSYTDWNEHMGNGDGPLTSCMIGRGALIKPWVFTEIKEQRHWDISAGERLDMLKSFCSAGLEHWGSDSRGVETTRKFLLEWLSYTHRYIPVGLLEVVPQKLHWRPPALCCRSDLEQLLASEHPGDWVRISEMLLGPSPPGFTFTPKHKSSAYSSTATLTPTARQAGYEPDGQAEG